MGHTAPGQDLALVVGVPGIERRLDEEGRLAIGFDRVPAQVRPLRGAELPEKDQRAQSRGEGGGDGWAERATERLDPGRQNDQQRTLTSLNSTHDFCIEVALESLALKRSALLS